MGLPSIRYLPSVSIDCLASRAKPECRFDRPDNLPYEECAELREALEAQGVGLVQMVTPVSRDRLAMLCREARGFIYAVTMTGTTGKSVAVPTEVTAYLQTVRRWRRFRCVPALAFVLRNRCGC
jgi:tryptophan synthase alpha chain